MGGRNGLLWSKTIRGKDGQNMEQGFSHSFGSFVNANDHLCSGAPDGFLFCICNCSESLSNIRKLGSYGARSRNPMASGSPRYLLRWHIGDCVLSRPQWNLRVVNTLWGRSSFLTTDRNQCVLSGIRGTNPGNISPRYSSHSVLPGTDWPPRCPQGQTRIFRVP